MADKKVCISIESVKINIFSKDENINDLILSFDTLCKNVFEFIKLRIPIDILITFDSIPKKDCVTDKCYSVFLSYLIRWEKY